MRSFYRRHLSARPASLLVLLLALVGTSSAWAQVRGISYTLSPVGEYVFFDGDAGVENQLFYGGELGFGFGQLVELNAVYVFNNDVLTDYADITDISQELTERLVALDGRSVGIQRYGGMVKVNLGTGALVPYVQAGTGIMRFDPEARNASRTIYLAGGLGLQFSVADRYTLRIGAQNLSYRYNLGATFFDADDLAGAGLLPENFRETTVTNWAGRAALEFYLGGRDPHAGTELDRALRSQLTGGLRGLSVPIEPFYGSISFDDAFGLRETQRMAGVYAGINLGPYVGVRGFYWRGIEEDATVAFDDLQAYGGEVKFRLGDGGNITPFLLLGGGYLDVLDGYAGRPDAATAAEDHPFAIGGVGATIPLGDALRINASARNLLMSTQGVDNVDGPNDVQGSWMYSAGLSFVLGGRGGASAGSIVEDRLDRMRAEGATRQEVMEAELVRLQARLDSVSAAQDRLAERRMEGDAQTRARLDSLASVDTRTLAPAQADSLERLRRALVERLQAQEADTMRAMQTAEVAEARTRSRSNLSDRTLTIPIPEEGEIYLRFGPAASAGTETYGVPVVMPDGTVAYRTGADTAAAGMTAEEVRRLVAEAVAAERRSEVSTEGARTAEVQALQRRLADLEARLEARDDELARLRRERDAAPDVTIIERNDRGELVAVEDDGEIVESYDGDDVVYEEVSGGGLLGSRELAGLYPHVGFTTGDGRDQFLIGVRGDYRSVTGGRLRLLPELALGLGGGSTSLTALANAAVPVGGELAGAFRPYVGAGLGLVSVDIVDDIDLVFNLLVGAEYPLGASSVFGEYSTLNFLDVNRLLVGYRLRF